MDKEFSVFATASLLLFSFVLSTDLFSWIFPGCDDWLAFVPVYSLLLSSILFTVLTSCSWNSVCLHLSISFYSPHPALAQTCSTILVFLTLLFAWSSFTWDVNSLLQLNFTIKIHKALQHLSTGYKAVLQSPVLCIQTVFILIPPLWDKLDFSICIQWKWICE